LVVQAAELLAFLRAARRVVLGIEVEDGASPREVVAAHRRAGVGGQLELGDPGACGHRRPSLTKRPPTTSYSCAVRAVIGVLARFVSCGVLGVAGGVLWRFTLAPSRVGIASA